MSDLAIRTRDLKKTFDDKEYVLRGIDLEIPKNSITFVIGYSGTGKSVLIKHFLGLLKPTSGTLEILGQNVNEISETDLVEFRKKFGVLFQGAALFDDMTALENVLFPLNEHRRDLSLNKRKEIAAARLKLVGLDEKDFQKLPAQLSGGMQKRVGLARALALDPEILLYDEPTTGLDPIITEMVDNLISSTHKRRGDLTSIIVSHDISAAFRLADYIAMLDKGKVLLFGKPEEFFESDIDLVKRFISKGIYKK